MAPSDRPIKPPKLARPRAAATPAKPAAPMPPMPGASFLAPPDNATDDTIPFWKRKRLSQMTDPEWESLCDGCGRCCLNKLQDDSSDKIFYTDVGCVLLDGATARCCDYPNRQATVKDCVRLTPRNVKRIKWLPPSCGYRLVAEGRDLYWWHPLVSGDPDTVHQAGVSVKDKVGANERDVPDNELENHIVNWPLRMPKGARGKVRRS